MKRSGLFLILVVAASLVLAGCGASVDHLYCPINYVTNPVSCQVGGVNPDVKTFEELPSLRLEQNQVGIFNPPGDAQPIVVRDIAANSVPAKYSLIYPTVKMTYRTNASPIDANGNFQACTEYENKNKLCATPLDQVRLKGGVQAVVEYEIDFTIIVNQNTAPRLAKLTYGFADLVKSLDGFTRNEFRHANEVDPSTYTDGTMDGILQSKYASVIKNWENIDLVSISAIRVRKTSVAGYQAQATEIKGQQGIEQAKAYATMEATACGRYEQEAYRSYCMAVFIWSQKQDGSSMPQPPAGYPALTPPSK